MKAFNPGITTENFLTAAVTAALSLLSMVSSAQSVQPLEEVIVTAERRTESLQEVPLSVTVFSADQINDAGIVGLNDVAQQTPNLTFANWTLTEPQVFLRGIGNVIRSAASDPAVAIFVDEVYIGRAAGASTELYDLERIEVLRGPQGTLYGKNAAGGAVNIFTRKPQREFEARAGVAAGNYDLVKFNGYVNGPLTETLAGKITVSSHKRDGYAKNITTGQELEDLDSLAVRGQLLFTPSERIDVLLGFDYNDIDSNGESRFITDIDTETDDPLASIPAIKEKYIATVEGLDERETAHGLHQYADLEALGLLGRVDIDLDWGVLTSISAYRETDSSWLQSVNTTESEPHLSDPNRVPGIGDVYDGSNQEADQFSQEIRLSAENYRFKWVLGLYYMEENVDGSEDFVTWWDPITPFAVFSPGDVTFLQDAKTTSYAGFGQGTWNVTESLALTLGARYTRDDKDIDQTAINNLGNSLPSGIPLIGPPYDVSADKSWDDTSLRASADWRIDDDKLLYVTYSEGFKSGIFSSQQGSPEEAVKPVGPEHATNVEVGAKTQWWDNRLRFNIAYFDLDYDDLQIFYLDGFFLRSENANAEVSGIELDFAAVISDRFMMTGSYATMDSEYTEYVTPVEDFTGNQLIRAPEETWTVTGIYTIPFDSGATLDLTATASHTGDFFYVPSNVELSHQKAYEVYDASANFTSADGAWTLSIWGKNLDDELYTVSKLPGTFGGAGVLWAPPRTYGASLNYYWK